MNIFKALSLGDGSINETNISSFLSFIFNESNDFSSAFLLLFLDLIEEQPNEIRFQKFIEYSGNTFRQRIKDFTEKYTYSAIPEYRVGNNGRTQDVDIVITISERISENDCCYFLIENKIRKSSMKEKQCLQQYQLFRMMEDYQDNVPVISVLISPDLHNFSTMFENVKSENSFSVWLKWETENGNSIIDIFRKLINLESNSEITPIENNTQFIIKSFIDFISTELSIKERIMNFSIAGSEVIEQTEFEMNNKKYFLKRFDNKMIRIFDSNNEISNEPVKPLLRKIIELYKLDVDLERESGNRKNTQILGRDVIRELSCR